MQCAIKIHKRHISKVSSELKKNQKNCDKQPFITPFYCQAVMSDTSFLSEGMPKKE